MAPMGNEFVDQWNKTESLEINSHSYCHLIFDGGKIYTYTHIGGG